MKDPRQIVLRPVLTEKTTGNIEHLNQYTFRVHSKANKVEIRKAIEEIFGVAVVRVNTLKKMGKPKRRKWLVGRTPGWKEAIVTLRKGQKIDIY